MIHLFRRPTWHKNINFYQHYISHNLCLNYLRVRSGEFRARWGWSQLPPLKVCTLIPERRCETIRQVCHIAVTHFLKSTSTYLVSFNRCVWRNVLASSGPWVGPAPSIYPGFAEPASKVADCPGRTFKNTQREVLSKCVMLNKHVYLRSYE